MAIKINYDDGNNFHPNAYLKIQKISCSSVENETYILKDDIEYLKWNKIPEHVAYIFVYGDEEARKNNARPIHSFGIEFEYDLENGGNIYKCAYESLKKIERFKDEIIEDV
jgi:hypothetical protein